jgi:hypothetical protein
MEIFVPSDWVFDLSLCLSPISAFRSTDFARQEIVAFSFAYEFRTKPAKSGGLEKTGRRETNSGSGVVHSVNSFGA